MKHIKIGVLFALLLLCSLFLGCIGQEEEEQMGEFTETPEETGEPSETPELDVAEDITVDRIVVETQFSASESGTGYAVTVSIYDEWDVNDIKLGINTDTSIDGFWLRVAVNGVINDYGLGSADSDYHRYMIEYHEGLVRVYIDGDLKKTFSMRFTQPYISIHANARMQGDTVEAQFSEIRVDLLLGDHDVHFEDYFDDVDIDPVWIIGKPHWMSITEKDGALIMSGSAEHDIWGPAGTATLDLSTFYPSRYIYLCHMILVGHAVVLLFTV